MTYRHTQSAFWPWTVALAGVVALAVLLVVTDDLAGSSLAMLVVVTAVVAVGFLFARLTVAVEPTEIVVEFGAGWPRRRIPRADVVSAHAVRNRWWLGWGVRLIPRGSMYNVWGLDAVELVLRSGKVFRIGTDEPDVLLAAVTAPSGQAEPSGPSGPTG